MTIASLLVSNSVHDCPPLLWPRQDANRAGPKNDPPQCAALDFTAALTGLLQSSAVDTADPTVSPF